MRISKEDKDELEMLIIEKMKIAVSAITGSSDAESDQRAADAVNSLSNALLNISAYMDAEPIEYKEEMDAEPIEYKEENEAPKRKLANAGNEMIIRFKVLVDQLQDTFDQACQCIEIEQAKDRAVKMDEALRQVVEKFSRNWRL